MTKAMVHRLRSLYVIGLVAGWCACARPAREDDRPLRLEGWYLSGPSTQFRAVADPSVAHGGRASARLEATGLDPDGAGSLTQALPADAYRGKRVRFSGFVRTDGVAGWAGLWMRVDRPRRRGAFDNMQDRPVRGTTTWTSYQVVLDVADDALALQFGLVQDGTGISHLDDAALEIVGRDVAVTDLDRRPRALQNAGFEAGGELPQGWLVDGYGKDDVAVTVDRGQPHGGAASARIERRVDHPRGETMVLQHLRADDYHGKRLRAVGWLKGSDVATARLFTSVQAADAGEASAGVSGGACALPSGSFAWRRCDVVFDVPTDGDTLEIGVAVTGPGTLWIDDVELAEVGLDVPVTGRDQGARTLVNGDFENDDAGLRPWLIAGGARGHYEASLDRTVTYRGKASARLAPRVETPRGYGVLMQGIDATDYRGQRVRVTAALKHLDARGELWVRVQTASSPSDGPGLSWGSYPIRGTADWRVIELVVDVPRGGDSIGDSIGDSFADSIQVGAGLRGRGTLWLDDVRVEAVAHDVPLTPAAPTRRALVNGDFEAGDEPDGWFLSGGARDDYAAAIDRTEHAHGTASARLRPRVAAPTGYATLMQSIPAGELRGKRMRMTAQVKDQASAGGGLWLRVQAAYSPSDGPGRGGELCRLSASVAWQPCEEVFDVPEAADAIQIGLGLAGTGTLWLDQVTLDEVSRDVPVTTVVRATPRPTNLDFETVAPSE